jgi:ABC-type antimicrobial peptide transport system permease subunit
VLLVCAGLTIQGFARLARVYQGFEPASVLRVAISRAMTSLIFGIVSMDVTILAGFTALLFLVALGAGYLPARRALRIDPMVALRYE